MAIYPTFGGGLSYAAMARSPVATFSVICRLRVAISNLPITSNDRCAHNNKSANPYLTAKRSQCPSMPQSVRIRELYSDRARTLIKQSGPDLSNQTLKLSQSKLLIFTIP